MVFGTGGAAGCGAGTGLLGVDADLAALGSAVLAEEDDGDFGTGLAAGLTTSLTFALTGLTVALTIGLRTDFITDLTAGFFLMTSFVLDFLTGADFLTAAGLALGFVTLATFFNAGLTTFFAVTLLAGFTTFLVTVLATGFAAFLASTFTGVLFFLAGAFTSCLLWALACG